MTAPDTMREVVEEARRQLEYLDGRWPTGTTPAIIARIDAVLDSRPATNQAGGVAKIARDHVEAFIVQSRLGGLMDGDEALLTSLFRQALLAALATQPATSQEGEGNYRNLCGSSIGVTSTPPPAFAMDQAEGWLWAPGPLTRSEKALIVLFAIVGAVFAWFEVRS